MTGFIDFDNLNQELQDMITQALNGDFEPNFNIIDPVEASVNWDSAQYPEGQSIFAIYYDPTRAIQPVTIESWATMLYEIRQIVPDGEIKVTTYKNTDEDLAIQTIESANRGAFGGIFIRTLNPTTNGWNQVSELLYARTVNNIEPDNTGNITLPNASDTVAGLVKVDNDTITIDSNGVISANYTPTTSEQYVFEDSGSWYKEPYEYTEKGVYLYDNIPTSQKPSLTHTILTLTGAQVTDNEYLARIQTMIGEDKSERIITVTFLRGNNINVSPYQTGYNTAIFKSISNYSNMGNQQEWGNYSITYVPMSGDGNPNTLNIYGTGGSTYVDLETNTLFVLTDDSGDFNITNNPWKAVASEDTQYVFKDSGNFMKNVEEYPKEGIYVYTDFDDVNKEELATLLKGINKVEYSIDDFTTICTTTIADKFSERVYEFTINKGFNRGSDSLGGVDNFKIRMYYTAEFNSLTQKQEWISYYADVVPMRGQSNPNTTHVYGAGRATYLEIPTDTLYVLEDNTKEYNESTNVWVPVSNTITPIEENYFFETGAWNKPISSYTKNGTYVNIVTDTTEIDRFIGEVQDVINFWSDVTKPRTLKIETIITDDICQKYATVIIESGNSAMAITDPLITYYTFSEENNGVKTWRKGTGNVSNIGGYYDPNEYNVYGVGEITYTDNRYNLVYILETDGEYDPVDNPWVLASNYQFVYPSEPIFVTGFQNKHQGVFYENYNGKDDYLRIDTLDFLSENFNFNFTNAQNNERIYSYTQTRVEKDSLRQELYVQLNGDKIIPGCSSEINQVITAFRNVDETSPSVFGKWQYNLPPLTGKGDPNELKVYAVKGSIYIDELTAQIYKLTNPLYNYNPSTNHWQLMPGQTVVDNLTSTSTTSSLSANQGRILKNMIDAVSPVQVVDNLTSTDTNKALSANMGKVLKDSIVVYDYDGDLNKQPTIENFEKEGLYITPVMEGDARTQLNILVQSLTGGIYGVNVLHGDLMTEISSAYSAQTLVIEYNAGGNVTYGVMKASVILRRMSTNRTTWSAWSYEYPQIQGTIDPNANNISGFGQTLYYRSDTNETYRLEDNTQTFNLGSNKWIKLHSNPIATESVLGVVKVDGTTVTIDGDGTLHAIGAGGSGSNVIVIDNLTSTSTTDALSANQGKELNRYIDMLNNNISNNSQKILDLTDGLNTTDGRVDDLEARLDDIEPVVVNGELGTLIGLNNGEDIEELYPENKVYLISDFTDDKKQSLLSFLPGNSSQYTIDNFSYMGHVRRTDDLIEIYITMRVILDSRGIPNPYVQLYSYSLDFERWQGITVSYPVISAYGDPNQLSVGGMIGTRYLDTSTSSMWRLKNKLLSWQPLGKDANKGDGWELEQNQTLVLDTLTSTSTTDALSANMGRELYDTLDYTGRVADMALTQGDTAYDLARTNSVDLRNHVEKIASTTELGHVKIDGDTIVIDSDGIIRAVGDPTIYPEFVYFDGKVNIEPNSTYFPNPAVYYCPSPKVTALAQCRAVLNNAFGTQFDNADVKVENTVYVTNSEKKMVLSYQFTKSSEINSSINGMKVDFIRYNIDEDSWTNWTIQYYPMQGHGNPNDLNLFGTNGAVYMDIYHGGVYRLKDSMLSYDPVDNPWVKFTDDAGFYLAGGNIILAPTLENFPKNGVYYNPLLEGAHKNLIGSLLITLTGSSYNVNNIRASLRTEVTDSIVKQKLIIEMVTGGNVANGVQKGTLILNRTATTDRSAWNEWEEYYPVIQGEVDPNEKNIFAFSKSIYVNTVTNKEYRLTDNTISQNQSTNPWILKPSANIVDNLSSSSVDEALSANMGQELKFLTQAVQARLDNHSIEVATDSKIGHVKVDGTTITVDGDGTIHAVGSGSGANVIVIDNLTSTSTTDALSANQGKELNDALVASYSAISHAENMADIANTNVDSLSDRLDAHEQWLGISTPGHVYVDGVSIAIAPGGVISVEVMDTLNSPSTARPLSANQGRVLLDLLNQEKAETDNEIAVINSNISDLRNTLIDSTGELELHETVIASTSELGHVKIDGSTITIDNGVITANYANALSDMNNRLIGLDNMLDADELALNNHIATIASDTESGHVKVDGTTIVINSQGVISGTQVVNNLITDSDTSALSATQGRILKSALDAHEDVIASAVNLGHVKVDGTSITVDNDGVISTNSVRTVNNVHPDANGNVDIVIPNIQVIDNVSSSSTTDALSAKQGNVLQLGINALAQNLGDTNSVIGDLDNRVMDIEMGNSEIQQDILNIKYTGNYVANELDTHMKTVASTSVLGHVKIDGNTIKLNANNQLVIGTSTLGELGGVKVDGTSITIDADGTIHSHVTGGIGVQSINNLQPDAQGNIDIEGVTVTDDLTTTSSINALSAKQGYELNQRLVNVSNTANDLLASVTSHTTKEATTSELGHVKYDDATIFKNDQAQLYVKDASTTQKGVVMTTDSYTGSSSTSVPTSKALSSALTYVTGVITDSNQVLRDAIDLRSTSYKLEATYKKVTLPANTSTFSVSVAKAEYDKSLIEVYDAGLLLFPNEDYTQSYNATTGVINFTWTAKSYNTVMTVRLTKVVGI